jgi:hypothetical protein
VVNLQVIHVIRLVVLFDKLCDFTVSFTGIGSGFEFCKSVRRLGPKEM